MYFWPSSVWTRAASCFSAAALSFLTLPLPVVVHAPSSADRATAASARAKTSRGMCHRLFELAAEFGLAARAVHDLALELAAGRVDILAARAPDHGQDVRIEQNFLERADRRLAGTREPGAVEWVERNQIDLRRQSAHQLDQLARMLGFVVDAFEHRVFERDRRARTTRRVARTRREQFVDRVFLVERHELGAKLVIRCVQRNGKRYVARL